MSISFTYLSGRLTVYLSGELDHHAARETMQKITELLDEYLPRRCVLDLSDLRFMDSSGVALIVRLSRRMRELGGALYVENPVGQARRVLSCAGVDKLVHLATIGG